MSFTSTLQRNEKQLVNEYTQHIHIDPPQYHCWPESNMKGAHFFCTMSVASQSFSTKQAYRTKKLAEMEAAKLACEALNLRKVNSSSASLPNHAKESLTSAPKNYPHHKTIADKPPDAIAVSSITEVYKYLTDEMIAILFKSLLHHHAQDNKKDYPIFQSQSAVENGLRGWVGSVKYDGQTFNSLGLMQTKRQAEQSSAEVCLRELGYLQYFTNEDQFTIQRYKGGHSVNFAPNNIPRAKICTTLLNIIAGQYAMQIPTCHAKEVQGKQYVGVCYFDGKLFESSYSSNTANEARQSIAMEVLKFLGHPDAVKDTDMMNKIRFHRHRSYIPWGLKATPFSHAPSQWRGWVLTHYKDILTPSGDELSEEDKKMIVKQTQEPDSLNELLLREPAILGVALKDKTDLSMGEVSFEDKDIVTVGNNEFSIRMYCENKTLYCRNRKRDVEIMPGHRVIGLTSSYRVCSPSLQIYLKAESCQDLYFPNPALPCVRSCSGILLLHDHDMGDDVYVMLQRSCSDESFAPVGNTLAMYFGQVISGKLIPLNIESVTGHIDKWLDKDVRLLSEMTMDSMKELFTFLYKYDDRWNEIFVKELPEDLLRLKNICKNELSKREVQNKHLVTTDGRPWRLPGSMFKHRLFNTGILLEDSHFCVFRAVREHAGIRIKLGEIETSTVLDLPVTGNPNPHRGDVDRYYIWSRCRSNNEDGEDYYGEPDLHLPNPEERWTCDKDAIKRSKTKERSRLNNLKRKAELLHESSRDKFLKFDDNESSGNFVGTERVDIKEEMTSATFTPSKHREVLHDECRWFTVSEARTKCPLFDEIYEAPEMQKELASLQPKCTE